MKNTQVLLYLTLLLGISYGYPTGDTKAPKQLKLAHTCVHMTNGTKNDKPTVVLLHGVLSFKEIWIGLMPLIAMKTGRRVCAADLRNHGDSPWSDESDTATMASDLNLLMKTLNTEKIALLGHSLGGKIAVDFTLKNPDKVEKLIVEDMRPNGLSEEARQLLLKNENPLTDALSVIPDGSTEAEAKLIVFRFIKFMLQMINSELEIDDRLAEYVPIKCSNGKCRWKANVALLEKIRPNIEKYMPESTGLFEKPALFIYGGKSSFKIGDVKDEILKLFPKTKFVEVKRASHIVNTFPEYKEAVVNFLNDEK